MELSSIQHIEPSQLADFQADIFITSLGHESRTTHISRLLENHSCRKVALDSPKCLKELSYEANREYYQSKDFSIVIVESDVPDLGSVFGALSGEDIGIMIDCTNTPPAWYHHIFNWFDGMQDYEGIVRMRILYTMPAYEAMEDGYKLREMKNFLQSDIKHSERKKKALILGLGQEKNIGASILKMVNPDLLYLYYTDPPAEKKVVESVFVNNHALIKTTPIKNLVPYPIRNGQAIYQSLINTILPLRNDYSVTIIPHGPKIFSVVAMLVHLGYPDVKISYPSFKKPPVADLSPIGEPVVLDILFEGEE